MRGKRHGGIVDSPRNHIIISYNESLYAGISMTLSWGWVAYTFFLQDWILVHSFMRRVKLKIYKGETEGLLLIAVLETPLRRRCKNLKKYKEIT